MGPNFIFGLIPWFKAATKCLFGTMAAARKARELGEALVNVKTRPGG